MRLIIKIIILTLLFNNHSISKEVDLNCERNNTDDENLLIKINYDKNSIKIGEWNESSVFYDKDFIYGYSDIENPKFNAMRYKISRKSGQLINEAYILSETENDDLVKNVSEAYAKYLSETPSKEKQKFYHQKLMYDYLDTKIYYGQVIYNCKIAENKF